MQDLQASVLRRMKAAELESREWIDAALAQAEATNHKGVRFVISGHIIPKAAVGVARIGYHKAVRHVFDAGVAAVREAGDDPGDNLSAIAQWIRSQPRLAVIKRLIDERREYWQLQLEQDSEPSTARERGRPATDNGDPLAGKDSVTKREAVGYLALSERRVEILTKDGVLETIGRGQYKRWKVESLYRYKPPKEIPK